MENLNSRVDLVNKVTHHEKQGNKYFVIALILCVAAITVTVFLGGYNLISMILIGIAWTFIFLHLGEHLKKGRVKKKIDNIEIINILDDPVTPVPDTDNE